MLPDWSGNLVQTGNTAASVQRHFRSLRSGAQWKHGGRRTSGHSLAAGGGGGGRRGQPPGGRQPGVGPSGGGRGGEEPHRARRGKF